MKPVKLRIGGVPEHFNLPWRLAISSGELTDLGVDASWMDFPGGTGSMVAALNEAEVDIAMLLSEGAIKGLNHKCEYEILSFYTTTPLLWGIHVAADSDITILDDCENLRFAISRYGSGSHLMSYVLADQQNWPLSDLQFERVGNLDGARDYMANTKDVVFLWEKFMTQPLVDEGEFRCVAVIPTPWPCFVVCVRKSVLQNHSDLISSILQSVFECAEELKASPIAAKVIAATYALDVDETRKWLKLTDWATSIDLNPDTLDQIKDTLKRLKLI
ncbi:MAG: ABC transporter substrate-binding protein [Gammaproteobacteria bacterium]|nr:ABC transporter substrate-binding protein [Gammaproteobacteria bacterium]NNC96443.1 ABC transporter substrate-binding protein [Gammaproteobacteria bacterium]NNM13448.1 ABC transporter substrate-binding protein [Gammaproteobacteria bacterium]